VVEYSLALTIDVMLIISIVACLNIEVERSLERVPLSLRTILDYILASRVVSEASSIHGSFKVIRICGPHSGLVILYLRV